MIYRLVSSRPRYGDGAHYPLKDCTGCGRPWGSCQCDGGE